VDASLVKGHTCFFSTVDPYFASPEKVLPMPPLRMSSSCNEATFDSIFEHFKAETLSRQLGDVQLPTVFVLGADSPIRPRYDIATAALMPNATYQIESTGHLVWMERPRAVRKALDGNFGAASSSDAPG
jgi:pimeloyl-ACP methyl ester carboxylesterase